MLGAVAIEIWMRDMPRVWKSVARSVAASDRLMSAGRWRAQLPHLNPSLKRLTKRCALPRRLATKSRRVAGNSNGIVCVLGTSCPALPSERLSWHVSFGKQGSGWGRCYDCVDVDVGADVVGCVMLCRALLFLLLLLVSGFAISLTLF